MDEDGLTAWAAGSQGRLLRVALLLTGDLHRVAPAEFRGQDLDLTWYPAAWDFREGTFGRLAEGDDRMRAMEVATALVEDGSP